MIARTPARFRTAVAAAALLALPALSSCGVNFGAQTDQVYAPADGQNSHEGKVDVLNALVVSKDPGRGRLIAGLVNNDTQKPDSLVEVTGADQAQGLTITMTGNAQIPAGGLLQLADADAPVVLVTGGEDRLRPGKFVRVTFTFENADPVTLNIPVLDPGSDYGDVEIPEATGPSSTPSSANSEG